MKITNTATLQKAFDKISEVNEKQEVIGKELNAKIAELKKAAEKELSKVSKKKEELLKDVESYVTENKSIIFTNKKKSIELANVTFGFKKTPGKVVTDKTTGDLLMKFVGPEYVKVTYDPIKASLKKLSKDQLDACKIKIEEGKETFFVKFNGKSVEEK